jgi:hypothetical protein
VISVEEIKKEIDRVPQDKLDGLYRFVRNLSNASIRKRARQQTIERMTAIRINGPSDLATNLDEYLYFGKEIEK